MDPPWTGWNVATLAVVSFSTLVFCMMGVAYLAQRIFYPQTAFGLVIESPVIIVTGQLIAYLLILLYMYSILAHRLHGSFWRNVRWNWPEGTACFFYILGGAVLALSLQGVSHFLPMPKELPIDQFFRTPAEAFLVTSFGVSLAPLMEELFFRGFLYPVLARNLGKVVAVVLTALSFGLLHAPQLGRAWAPVLIVVLVGLALTITRAITRSVGASFLVHVAYNATLSLMIFVSTDGFRQLDKLTQ
jgi:membrane protease YdiL (CAAX protease family)